MPSEPGPLADLHLLVGGKRIDPVVNGFTARFLLPAGARNPVLVSRTARPSDLGDSGDTRKLGVCVERLTIVDGFANHQIPPDDERLSIGFHDAEEGPRRWTSGRTPLSNDLFAGHPHGFFLVVELAGEPLAR